MREESSLIRALKRLVDREKPDRGALASLRRGLGKPPGTASEMFPLVEPWVPDNRRTRPEPYYIVAALFGSHPHWMAAPRDFGGTLRRIVDARGESPSLELRFRSLLAADLPELPTHLRQALQLGRGQGEAVGVDYDALLRDLIHWEDADRWVQRRWARSFWTPRSKGSAESETTEESQEA